MHKVFPMSYPESSAKHPNSAAGVPRLSLLSMDRLAKN